MKNTITDKVGPFLLGATTAAIVMAVIVWAAIIVTDDTPAEPEATPLVQKDWVAYDVARMVDLKDLCGTKYAECQARQLATQWLEDIDAFDDNLVSGLYGIPDNRTAQYHVDKTQLANDLYYAIATLERMCMGG